MSEDRWGGCVPRAGVPALLSASSQVPPEALGSRHSQELQTEKHGPAVQGRRGTQGQVAWHRGHGHDLQLSRGDSAGRPRKSIRPSDLILSHEFCSLPQGPAQHGLGHRLGLMRPQTSHGSGCSQGCSASWGQHHPQCLHKDNLFLSVVQVARLTRVIHQLR